MNVVIAVVGAVLVALFFFASVGKKEEQKAAEAPKPEVVDGVELDREMSLALYASNWTPAIKIPGGTCIFFWVPRNEPIGVQVKATYKGFHWTNLAEWEQKYSHYGDWNLIQFIGMASQGGPGGTLLRYKFSKKPRRGCSFLTRNGVLRTYEEVERDLVKMEVLRLEPGRAVDLSGDGFTCVDDGLTAEELRHVRRHFGSKTVSYIASLAAPRIEKRVWFYDDVGKGCDEARRSLEERRLITR